MHPLIKQELDNLEIQFPNRAMLTLDDYADLYQIERRNASRHCRRRGVPVIKEGRELYISTLDLAIYKAQRKAKATGNIIVLPQDPKGVARKGGFGQAADRRQLGTG